MSCGWNRSDWADRTYAAGKWLIVRRVAKDRLLGCKRRQIASQKVAFWKTKSHQLKNRSSQT